MIVFGKLGHYGRLGNQLFQIASTVGIASKNNADYAFPEWDYAEYFRGEFPISPSLDYKLYQEPSPYYSEVVLDNSTDWCLEGYFQSWKYFEHCKDKILDLFYFEKEKIDAIAVHVRRGDYLKLQYVHPVLDLDYYKNAMEVFRGEQFTVFSDDIEWCKENLPRNNVSYSDSMSLNPIEDFKKMASHKGVIMANSSYSWWAAYLSETNNVVAPSRYVIGEDRDDRIPPEWTKI